MATIGTIALGTLRAMGWTLRNVFRPATTVPYPRRKRAIPKTWRAGSFALTFDPATGEENCIGCRLCEYACPSEIIAVTLRKGEARKNGIGATYCDKFTLDYQACMQCELCIQVCPTDAIVMTRALAPAALTRDALFLSKERLMENGRALVESPDLTSFATGTRLREWTDVTRGLPKPDPDPAP
ncbi:MAG TPA: 4Fe-4S binding protein [Candidatus Polarisedimenticolaceae bacterium]|nr:4Fe-4S binding protein [Candidatus Polarisedimenticolaceae bacterium]